MKNKILVTALALLSITPIAKADDPCFDGMCSISVNVSTGKTTITRLSDWEIAIRLAAKAEQDRLAAIIKAQADKIAALEEANKPKPVVIDTPIVVAPPVVRVETITVSAPVRVETVTVQAPVIVAAVTQSNTQPAPVAPIVETKTAIVELITNVPTVTSLKTTTVQLSDVIWGLKNQIIEMKKLNAKILVRTKKK